MKKIIKNNRYEILTPNGYAQFDGVSVCLKSNWLVITFKDNSSIEVTENHVFVKENGQEVKAKDLSRNDELKSLKTRKIVDNIEVLIKTDCAYDALEVSGHHYIANDVVNHNCDFLQSGDTVVEPDDIQYIEQTFMKDPEEMIKIRDGMYNLSKLDSFWIWKKPEAGRTYVIAADVARGDGTDNSAFSVWLLPNVEDVQKGKGPEQVAEFYEKVPTDTYGRILEIIGNTYNNAIIIVENVGIGIATLNELVKAEYQNLYFTDKSAKQISLDTGLNTQLSNNKVPGFTTSAKTRDLIVAATEAAWRSRQYIIRSKRQINEAKTWIWVNGKADHGAGCHDDLMMSSGIFFYLYQTSLEQQGIASERYIGALDLVTDRRKAAQDKMADIIKVNQQTRAQEWKLDYAAGGSAGRAQIEQKETWDLTEMIRR